VSFFDGEFAAILASFNLGIMREIDFLRRAKAEGFRIAGCVSAAGPVDQMVAAGVELLITHAGLPLPGHDDPTEAAAAQLRRRLGASAPLVIGAGALLATLTATRAPSAAPATG
jgi:predicted TIM-barrel enzyme